MKYICEICNKKFDTPEEAQNCEAIHKKSEAMTAEEKVISDAINAFIAKRKSLPYIELNKTSRDIMFAEIEGTINEAFDLLTSLFEGDDDKEE